MVGVTVVVTTGSGFTVYVTIAALLQPRASVPMTVYVKDDGAGTDWMAVTEDPVVADNPNDGLHA
jgi:hypothetical protein